METIKTSAAANINTKNYWEKRFMTGDWENRKWREQTTDFALTQLRYFPIPKKLKWLH